MNALIKKGSSFKSSIVLPLDKSIAQRAAILNVETNDGIVGGDVISTRLASKNAIANGEEKLYLGNSGTGIRLLTGYLSGLGRKFNLSGDISLSKRPMDRIADPLNELGAKVRLNNGKPPINILPSNLKKEFSYRLPIPSAQLKSSLLLAALNGKTKIEIIEPELSRDHTEKMLKYLECDIKIEYKDSLRRIYLNGEVPIKEKRVFIPGDFSAASFFIALTLLSENSRLLIPEVGINPSRIAFFDVLKEMNADISVENIKEKNNEVYADILVNSSKLRGRAIAKEIVPNLIDEIPILSMLAVFAEGSTFFEGLSELKVKESDRLKAIRSLLTEINAKFETNLDDLTIKGLGNNYSFSNAKFNSFNDHRIAMCGAILSSRSIDDIQINNVDSIETSFPNFFENLSSLGFTIDLS